MVLFYYPLYDVGSALVPVVQHPRYTRQSVPPTSFPYQIAPESPQLFRLGTDSLLGVFKPELGCVRSKRVRSESLVLAVNFGITRYFLQ